MNNATSPCSDDRLRVLLAGDEQHDAYRSAARHLESCADCQSRMADLAANRAEWAEIKRALRVDENEREIESEQMHRSWSGSGHRHPPESWTDAMTEQLLSPPSHPEMLGRLGRYEIERLIGVGGMAVVFKGFDCELNRPVAIKVLAPHLAGSGAARKRFAREARAAAAIVHEHVVAIHNVESDSEPPFLVMQYVAGQSLQNRLDRDGPLHVCEVLRIARQTAAGLAAAHQQGLVHRDVKPSNILLENGVERALLSDFGLARASDDASLTQSGHAAGTPNYMSPEQARGETADPRSDLFSLGSAMYAMCTGRAPFRAQTSYGVLRRIIDEPHRSVRQVNTDIPAWLSDIVDRLLAKTPDQRFKSAVEVEELLAAWLAHVQQPDVAAAPRSLGAQNSSPPIKLLVGGALALLMVLAGALAVRHFNRDAPAQHEPVATSRDETKRVDIPPAIDDEPTGDASSLRVVNDQRIVFTPRTCAPGETEIRWETGNARIKVLERTGGLCHFEYTLKQGRETTTYLCSVPADDKPVTVETRATNASPTGAAFFVEKSSAVTTSFSLRDAQVIHREDSTLASQEGDRDNTAAANEGRDAAIAAIVKLRGKLTYDDQRVLRSVYLSGSKITDEHLVHVAALTDAEGVVLYDTSVTDAGLAHLSKLTNLKGLRIERGKITGEGLAHIKSLQNVTRLSFRATDFNDAGMEQLQAFKNLEDLDLKGTQITDDGLKHLSGLASLKQLDLSGIPRRPGRITDAGLEHLKGVKQLESLELYANRQVTDDGVQHLKELTNLKWLMLKNTSVTREGEAELQRRLPDCKIIPSGV